MSPAFMRGWHLGQLQKSGDLISPPPASFQGLSPFARCLSLGAEGPAVKRTSWVWLISVAPLPIHSVRPQDLAL